MAVYDRWHRRKPQPGQQPCREHSRGSTVLYPSADHGKGDRYQVRWYDEDGKQCKKNLPKKNGENPEIHAEALDRQIQGQLQARDYVHPDAGKITLEEYAKQWRASRVADPNTLAGLDNRLAHIYDVEPGPRSRRPEGSSPIGDWPMRALAKKPSAIQAWIKSLEAKGLAPSYVRLLIDTLSSIFIAAIDDGIIHRNPVRASSVKAPALPKKLIVPWTWPMVEAAAAELAGRSAAIAYAGALAGLREGEIFGLAVEDIEFLGAGRMLHVRRQVRKVGGELVFSLPKGDKQRDVPLSESLSLRLAAHLKKHKPVKVTLPWKKPGGKPTSARLLFVRDDGRAWAGPSFVYWWHKARKAAGAPETPENGPHVLRHTAASAWLAGGVDIRKVAAWLGHADPGFTLRTYIHLMPDTEDVGRKAMDLFTGDKIDSPSAQNVPQKAAQ